MAKPLIDWYDDASHVFVNPLLPEGRKKLLKEAVNPYKDMKEHIWLASSGTENFPKMIALSKKAMLASAKAVNTHLQIEKQSSWLNILPLFHTGGLAIHARAHLSGSQVFDFSENKWDPIQYVKQLEEFNISFSSLTPTHVYDIVSRSLLPPKSLKAIVVGGGVFPEKLQEKGHALGWPLLKSYGMTEICSQIATASSTHPHANLELLNHVNLRFSAEGFIEIRSDALLTGFVQGNDPDKRFIDPKVEGWYISQDKGLATDGILQVFGRGANFIKIGGENISFSELETLWENIKVKHNCCQDVVLIDLPDERLGRIVCLVKTGTEHIVHLDTLIDEYHKEVIPIAKIRQIYTVNAIPRSELFKLKKHELRECILKLDCGD
ncbi:MAG: AMP-binding protein [Parachlamydiaceae bacterium]|nr:AMP-binding protein [Parachlamydiaceae bacterium]